MTQPNSSIVHTNFTRTLLLTFFLLSSLFVATGCKKSGSQGANGLSTKNNVVWSILSDIQRLNPYTSTDADAGYVQAEIWESLNGLDPRTLEVLPGLASRATISDDHLTYTFTMDPRARWSDRQPLTGDDVIFSFKAIMNPKVINSQSLRGYFQNVDSVFYPNGDRTKIAIKLHIPYFNAELFYGSHKIIPKHIWDPNGLTDKMTWSDLKNPDTKSAAVQEFATAFEAPTTSREAKYQIGSGPYLFAGWVTNDRLTLKKDTAYWGKDIPWGEAYPDELIFKTINDQNASLTALKNKDVDIIDNLKPSQYVGQLDTSGTSTLRKDSVYWNVFSFICWNNSRPLFADKNVRKALTMLIPRDQIIHSIMKDQAKKINGVVPFTQPDYDPTVQQPEFDVEGAKKLLADAGWKQGTDGILHKMLNGKDTPFRFIFQVNNGNEVRKQILLIIAEQLKKVGIDAGVSQLEWAVLLENTQSHNYDACYGAWAGSATEDDPYQLWHSSQAQNKGSNYYVYKSPIADKLIEQIRTELDQNKRFALSHQLQHQITDDQPISFLFTSPDLIGYVNRFDNLEFWRPRPCFDIRYWIVRGSGQKLAPHGIRMGNLRTASGA